MRSGTVVGAALTAVVVRLSAPSIARAAGKPAVTTGAAASRRP
jgi:hypothetical protein